MDFVELSKTCAPQVAHQTMAAIIKIESNANPYAIGINGKNQLVRQPQNREEAIATAQWLLKQGYNFDSGLGQINIKNVQWLGIKINDLFEPCQNLRAAGQVITSCYQRAENQYGEGQKALQAAISCYNTGSFTGGFNNGYVKKVISQSN